MANQTKQLARLLRGEGATVRLVQTNAPYRPRFVGLTRGVRALFRLVSYVRELRRAIRGATLVHIMANSGWSWHLFAAPALWVSHRSEVPAVLNYRGGDAARFFDRSFTRVERALRWAERVVVPSAFLEQVFEEFGIEVDVVPNIVDLERFHPQVETASNGGGPRVLISRNLEPLYDVETGIRAFARLRSEYEGAVLDIAGTGPEAHRLEALTEELGLSGAVRFLGRVDNEEMPSLYGRAHLALNTSLVDNMPISILEALASGVPVVSTRVGGVPTLVRDGQEAVLVPPREPEKMADALATLWREPARREALRTAGIAKAAQYGWSVVRDQWARVYNGVVETRR